MLFLASGLCRIGTGRCGCGSMLCSRLEQISSGKSGAASFFLLHIQPQLRQDTMIYPSAAWCFASLDLLEGAVARKT